MAKMSYKKNKKLKVAVDSCRTKGKRMHYPLCGVQLKSDKEALQDIVDGEKDDALTLQEINDLLDEAAEAFEAEGVNTDEDPLLNAAADKLTDILAVRCKGLL